MHPRYLLQGISTMFSWTFVSRRRKLAVGLFYAKVSIKLA
jgi:hypothetical protein